MTTQVRHQHRLKRYKGPLPGSATPADTRQAASSSDPGVVGDVKRTAQHATSGSGGARPRHGGQQASKNAERRKPLASKAADCWLCDAKVTDAYGMPATAHRFDTFAALEAEFNEGYREVFQKFRAAHRLQDVTSVQAVTMPMVMQHRDVCCVAPTGTGKTLCYLVPTVARLLVETNFEDEGFGTASKEDTTALDDLVRTHARNPSKCRYCGLDMGKMRVCPETGALHPPVQGEFDDEAARAQHVHDQTVVTEPRVVVMVPNSFLAAQIARVARQIQQQLKVGLLVRPADEAEKKRVSRSIDNCDVLVTVPAQLLTKLNKKEISLARVETIVLDEADALLQIGHIDVIKMIMARLPDPRKNRSAAAPTPRPQVLLFGATLPKPLLPIAKQLLAPTHRMVTSDVNTAGEISVNSSITHNVLMVAQLERVDKIKWLYESGRVTADQRVLVFCNSKATVSWLCGELSAALADHTVNIAYLTNKQTGEQRYAVSRMFQSGVSTLLIATDLCARGIDFRDVVYVVNFDMPVNFEEYHHRAGRCGRHGVPGFCYSLFQPEDARFARPLTALLRERNQLVPTRLQAYARQRFADVVQQAVRDTGGKTYRERNPEVHKPRLGLGASRFPRTSRDMATRNSAPTS
jgi:superfamily II DNA/RNA helicase